MDKGFQFEELMNSYLGRPVYVTYGTYWANKEKRIALLYTACIMEYDKYITGEISTKLEYFMTELFKNDDKKISVECLDFLKGIKSNS
jgi:hypothetical protein